MRSDNGIVTVQDLTKTYRMGIGRARVREMLPWPLDAGARALFPRWWSRNTFNALEGVSFTIPRGESVGIIGHNGAGKTTLLRLIADITEPTKGSIDVRGRVAALIDVLVGFHPELTGRENISLLGAMYGFSRHEMAARIPQILEFAEIDRLADTPLKRYSAGMGARLGFGTLAALDPEILLIDEVLSVGDAAFQRKCIGWLDEYRSRGGTLAFVSHNLAMVRSMTERAIWIDHGKLMSDGATSQVVVDYAKAMERRDLEPREGLRQHARKHLRSRGALRWGFGGARVSAVHIDESALLAERLKLSISYEAPDLSEAVFCVGFLDDSGRDVAATLSVPVDVRSSSGSVECLIEPVPLRDGIYFPVVAILSSDGRVRDRWRLDKAIVVDRNGHAGIAGDFGPVELPGNWSHAAL